VHVSPNGANPTFTNFQSFVEINPPSPQAVGVAEATTAVKLNLYWSRAVSSAMVMPTIGAQVDHYLSGVFAVRGCIKSGNPWNAQAGSTQAAVQTGVSAPGLTTTVDQSLVLFFVANTFDGASEQMSSFTAPTDLDNFQQYTMPNVWQITQGNGGGITVFGGIKRVAGPVNPLVCTLTNASPQALISIALTPAVIGGGQAVVNVEQVSDFVTLS
jgi:hypothetical protein